MSATLVSSNTTIKVNAAISAAATTGPGLGSQATLYTAPANGYAIVQVFNSNNIAVCRVVVGGRSVIDLNPGEPKGDNAAGAIPQITVYIGPSQSLVVENRDGGGNAASMVASGVEFVNTP